MVLDRLKQVGVRTSSWKNFGVRAAFDGRISYFTIIRLTVSLLTVPNIIHINVQPPESKNIISKHMQFDANHTLFTGDSQKYTVQ